ncbi:hypothetical protein MD484_g4701, partial [Candolleomyces efflorescens]
MKWLTAAVIPLGFLALPARSQPPAASKWCDPQISATIGAKLCWLRYFDADTDTSWGYIFPADTSSERQPLTEFIGLFSAPASAGWVGNSLGGPMHLNPLIVAWLDGKKPIISVRRTDSPHVSPEPLTAPGPVATLLPGSGLTSSGHQRFIYRCQNCTFWSGGTGGINLNGTANFGFATHTSTKPSSPSNSDSGLSQPNLAGQHLLDIQEARTPSYWDTLAALQSDFRPQHQFSFDDWTAR